MSLRQEMLKRRLKNSSVWYNRPAKATGEQIKRTYSKESSQRLMNLMKEVADINRKDANLLSDESEVAR